MLPAHPAPIHAHHCINVFSAMQLSVGVTPIRSVRVLRLLRASAESGFSVELSLREGEQRKSPLLVSHFCRFRVRRGHDFSSRKSMRGGVLVHLILALLQIADSAVSA